MNPNDPNVALLEVVGRHLGEALLQKVVFIGGAVAGLLITDPAMPAIRATEDVDVIVELISHGEYREVERSLLAQGFTQDLNDTAPICRWKIASVVVDVLPTIEKILGFTNRWYQNAVETAVTVDLPTGLRIKRITAPMFLATKLEAFAGRGNNDYLFSHDLGDILALIDGRESLIAECENENSELKIYLRQRLGSLLLAPAFIQALPGHLPGDRASQERVPDLEQKLVKLANLR